MNVDMTNLERDVAYLQRQGVLGEVLANPLMAAFQNLATTELADVLLAIVVTCNNRQESIETAVWDAVDRYFGKVKRAE